MEVDPRVFVEPRPDGRMLVGGVVVENHVDVEFGSHAALDLAEEPQKLLMPVARQALVDDLPGGYVEGSKECRRAVTFVVMGHGSSAPLLEGKIWLGAVEGLDLAAGTGVGPPAASAVPEYTHEYIPAKVWTTQSISGKEGPC